MVHIATYVFIDLETTGIPREEHNKTRITELSMIAVKRDHLLECRPGEAPRVQQKVNLCLNPRRLVQPDASQVSGLCNFLLEGEPTFNTQLCTMLHTFLDILTKPVCLVAQNGLNFDFPIFKNHLDSLNYTLTDDLLCADSLHAFYDILELGKGDITVPKSFVQFNVPSTHTVVNAKESSIANMRLLNETTPKKQIIRMDSLEVKNDNPNTKRDSRTKRTLFWDNNERPKCKYTLKDVYERLLNCEAVDCHRAEVDCMLLLKSAVAISQQFVRWVDCNNCLFADVKPMSIGVPIGLVLVALLWGATNPFIRRGTKGLKAVTSDSLLGQIYAEVTYLLGNWQYVLPFLVNQLGSLVYLVSLQRCQLSLAVPVTNSLAFVFTAITGFWLGEEPLNKRSLLGIFLIIAGTILCYTDKFNSIEVD